MHSSPSSPLLVHARSVPTEALTLETLEAWARGFAPFGREACARVAVACAERVLPYWQRSFPDVLVPEQQLDAVRAWLRDPSPETRQEVARLVEYDSAAADHIDPRDSSKNAEGAAANACVWAASMVTDDDPSYVFVAVRAAVHALEAEGVPDPERTVYETIRDALEAT